MNMKIGPNSDKWNHFSLWGTLLTVISVNILIFIWQDLSSSSESSSSDSEEEKKKKDKKKNKKKDKKKKKKKVDTTLNRK